MCFNISKLIIVIHECIEEDARRKWHFDGDTLYLLHKNPCVVNRYHINRCHPKKVHQIKIILVGQKSRVFRDAFKKKLHMEGHCPNKGGRG